MEDLHLDHSAVIGAAGKMGSGISFLILRETALCALRENIPFDQKNISVVLIDVNQENHSGLKEYLSTQLQKWGGKNSTLLRQYVSDVTLDDDSLVKKFVENALSIVTISEDLGSVKVSRFVFEAIVEDEAIKASVFKEIDKLTKGNAYFFTNTSSIPIHVLEEKSSILGRLIGYHFYNPPVVQKLLEIIPSNNIDRELHRFANKLGQDLGKTIVKSRDKAGFIGNGHFLRDILCAFSIVNDLDKQYEDWESLYLVNKMSHTFMIRPMGIFQLMDYVGSNVCQFILSVMRKYLDDESLQSEYLEVFVQNNIIGGQYSDGSQKDGIFSYEKGMITKVYSCKKGEYIELTQGEEERLTKTLGIKPQGWDSWSNLSKDKNKNAILKKYFNNLFSDTNLGSLLAQNYLKNSKEIAKQLVYDKVASSIDDVNLVLEKGFYHLYGPVNIYY